MENLDITVLSLVFEKLDLVDLINCSNVCKKWKDAVYIKNLFISYGTEFLPKKTKCLHEQFLEDKSNFLKPYFIYDDSIFSLLKIDFFQNIQTLIFHGNNTFEDPGLFKLNRLPNLKHFEIKDRKFCKNIFDEFQEETGPITSFRYYSSTVETLIVTEIEMYIVLVCFPNLKYIEVTDLNDDFCFNSMLEETKEISFEKIKWKSFISKARLYNSVRRFLTDECSSIESISCEIKFTEELDEFLNSSKIKNIFLKLYEEDNYKTIENFKSIIMKHEKRLTNDCNLCFNDLSIKNVNDFQSLIDKMKTSRVLLKNNEKYIEIYNSNNDLLIKHRSGIEIYKSLTQYSVFDNVLEVTLSNDYNFSNFFPDLFSILPTTIQSLRLFSDNVVSKKTFKLIPEYFPYLKSLNFQTPDSKITDYEIISKLKYLIGIYFEFLRLDFERLVEVLKNLIFIKEISINFNEDEENVFLLFKSFLEKKKDAYDLELTLNGKKYNLYKIKKKLDYLDIDY